jgi:hypothetical protein
MYVIVIKYIIKDEIADIFGNDIELL